MEIEQLKEKVKSYDFKTLFNKRNYAYFDKGAYNLNIIGIRSNGNRVTNLYDDLLVVIYKINDKVERRGIFNVTTDPGAAPMLNPINEKGTAILVEGQYRGAFKIGLHKNKYKALVQAKPLPVYRDRNKDLIFDKIESTIETGMFGINIHRSNQYYASKRVDSYSAGCQVFQTPIQFNQFMKLCEKSSKLYGNSFTYTLIDEKDLV